MSKGLEITRKAIGIIADALETASPAADQEARGVVKLLRAHQAGDNSADLFEAARQFNRLEVPLRNKVATESEKTAKARLGKAAAKPVEAPAPTPAPTLVAPAKPSAKDPKPPAKDQKTGSSLYGILNRR
jgi:hypothetical protein